MYARNRYKILNEQRERLGFNQCEYCGRAPLQSFNDKRRSFLTIDHVIPKYEGGSDELSNLKVCCIDCNHKKGSKELENVS